MLTGKLLTMSYNILSPATGLRKPCCQQNDSFLLLVGFLVLRQQDVCVQITQIVSGVSYITVHIAYAVTNKIKIVWIEMELIFYPRRTRLMFMCVLLRCCFRRRLVSTQTFNRALTESVEILTVPFQWRNQFCQSLGEGPRESEAWSVAEFLPLWQ